MVRKRRGRKLLVASLGVAAVSYVACGNTADSTGGQSDAMADAAGGTGGGGPPDVVANLVAPPVDAGDGAPEDVSTPIDVVANLIAPPDDGSTPDDAAPQDAVADRVTTIDVVANLLPPPIDSGAD